MIHPFEQIFESVEPVLPEACHLAGPVDQRSQRLRLRAVVRLPARVTVADEPGLLQYTQMLRYRRLRHACMGRQRGHRQLALLAQPLEERAARRIGKRPEQHVVSVLHVSINNSMVMD